MASAHVIEVGDATAGIVVLERGAFRFFASQPVFGPLKGALFRSAPSTRPPAPPATVSAPRRQPIRRPSVSSAGGPGDLAGAAFGLSRARSDRSPA